MDIIKLPGVELARLIKSGETSAAEVLEATLSRIREVDQHLNAFVNLDVSGARTQARLADQMVVDNAVEDLPALHGVPFTVKDLLNTAGVRSTYGSRAFAAYIPDTDAVGVARMRRAGAILVGKTTTPEFAVKVTTDSLLCGITRNPWNTRLTSGGSSGGAGVAVATGMGTLAVSTDGGGSARIPAAVCGVLGLKPTLGAIPHETWPFHFGNNSTVSINSRTVPDLAAMFNAMSGAHASDPLSRRLRRPVEIAKDPELKLKGKRLLMIPSMAGNTVDQEMLESVEAMLSLLASSGMNIEVASSDPIKFDSSIFSNLLTTNLAARVRSMTQQQQALLDPGLHQLLEGSGYHSDGVQLQQEAIERSRLYDRVETIFSEFDFIVTPTLTARPPPADSDGVQRVNIGGEMLPLSRWWIHLALANMTGHPAISIPCGFIGDSLPAGLNVMAGWDSEQELLDLAALIAVLKPWMDRWPEFNM
jgi:aspartyl-tRNA(Asn)/glutamyl-tRNA(Gln) amidotransferase subunit A